MSDSNTSRLQQELEQFRTEKEKIRNLIGQIGGKASEKNDMRINMVFITFMALLLLVDAFRHLGGIHIPLPPLFSLEVGILLVSIKIVWMIHKQGKVEHFQFWILNSIEFRLNDLSKRFQAIEEKLENAAVDENAL